MPKGISRVRFRFALAFGEARRAIRLEAAGLNVFWGQGQGRRKGRGPSGGGRGACAEDRNFFDSAIIRTLPTLHPIWERPFPTSKSAGLPIRVWVLTQFPRWKTLKQVRFLQPAGCLHAQEAAAIVGRKAKWGNTSPGRNITYGPRVAYGIPCFSEPHQSRKMCNFNLGDPFNASNEVMGHQAQTSFWNPRPRKNILVGV